MNANRRPIILIPQRGRPDLTAACVSSLRDHHPDAPVIVADDGSSDATRSTLDDLRVDVLRLPRVGVTATWNRLADAAVRCHGGGPLVFLNNDVLSRGPWLDDLVEPLAAPSIGLTGAACRTGQTDGQEGDLLEGWCFAVLSGTLARLGGFDERMAIYFSDTDLFLRARNAGLLLRCIPDLPLDHISHATAGGLPDRRRLWQSDRRAYETKWHGHTAKEGRVEHRFRP